MSSIREWFVALQPGDWSNFVTGLGTVVLACVAVYQSKLTARQVELGKRQATNAEVQAKTATEQAIIAREQADSAKASMEAAVQVQREAVRARADQYAPRVTVYFDNPAPPRADPRRNSMPGGNELRLLDQQSLDRSWDAAGHEFVFPQDQSTFLWFHGRGLVVNEGETSARVRLPSESRFIDGPSLFGDGEVQLPPLLEDGVVTEAVLPAGTRALFSWAAGKTVSEWVEGHKNVGQPVASESIWLWVTVFDSREVGVVDTLLAHFKPNVVKPVQGRESHWQVGEAGSFGEVHSLPAKRGYMHEGSNWADLSAMYAYFGLDEFGLKVEDAPKQGGS